MPKIFGAFIIVSLLPVATLSLQSDPPLKDEVPMPVLPVAQGLLAGCGDIPEVVMLIENLRIRENRVSRGLASLKERRDEIAASRDILTKELERLKSAKGASPESRTHQQRAIAEDISQLVAVYEAMKPKEAAEVLSQLPEDFSAELLMRLRPEAGARIIAVIEPEQAAVLTTYMGARSAVRK